MKDELITKFKNFVAEVAACENNELKEEAQDLLEEYFQEEVLELWKYDIISTSSRDFKNISLLDFIKWHVYSEEKSKFVTKNWNRVPEIITIIQLEIERRETKNVQ